ncbi:MAG: PAS domain S-box protein, partial [Acidobacteriota bacterium]
LALGMIPQVLCQVEILFGDTGSAHWQKLLAYGALLGGALHDYSGALRLDPMSPEERSTVEQELLAKTEALERLDMQRLWHEEKRRRAEMSLRMLGKAVETMSLGVTITDMGGKILYVNPADARMHGYPREELLGQDSKIYAAGVSSRLVEAGPEPWSRERLNRTRGGDTFPVRLVSDRVLDTGGSAVATVTICEDIRERIRIREALERRDHILEAVAFAAERFLAETAWNESLDEVLARLGEATEVGRVSLDLVADAGPFGPEDVTYAWTTKEKGAALPATFELVERWEDELRQGRALHGRGADLPIVERRAVEARGVGSFALVPLFVQSTWRGFLLLETRDPAREWPHVELEALKIAARTFGASILRSEYQGALQASEAKYRDLLEGANDLVQSVSPDGRFQFVNRAWKETLGYGDEEVGRLTVWDVVRPVSSDGRRDVLQNMLIEDGLGRIEAIFLAKDGTEISVEGVVSARYQDGLPVAAQGIFRDITERHHLDRMKQDFLSTVSHELRTPLTSIIASLGLLESGRLADHPQRLNELITVAHRNSNRLLKLINNLLDVQKIAARKMTFRSEPVAVKSLLEEAIRGIQAFADSCQVSLRLDGDPGSLRVLGDRDRLIQVLSNLLSNAIKFSPPGERVRLGASLSRGRVVIAVADHGPGIPEEFRHRLFDQFTQADPSKTRASGGSGLGLSIVKGLVEGMQGQINLDTEVGSGTTFYVSLPPADGAAAGRSSDGPRP